jgi:phenylpropionate dioxygenase-like ring-hydroxylating dioxygenase large terminal subunit
MIYFLHCKSIPCEDNRTMSISSGHWYAVLSVRELKRRPVGKTRFGQRYVFWRDTEGRAVCLEDRCPHRGAALSLGRLHNGTLACPYHGFRFAGDGHCIEVPAEGNWAPPDHFHASTRTVRESQGFIWMWRGPKLEPENLPPIPVQPVGADTRDFAECIQTWPAHYTRCVEGVIDHSHLPFVHKKTLGLFTRDPVTRIKVEPTACGFRSNLMRGDDVRHHVDLTYPNIWTQTLTPAYSMSTTFAPVDEITTEVYCRLHHRFSHPPMKFLMSIWNRFSQYMVFHEDMAILASQVPANIDDAEHEKLVPSDAAHIDYRKMRKRMQDELKTAAVLRSPDSKSETRLSESESKPQPT